MEIVDRIRKIVDEKSQSVTSFSKMIGVAQTTMNNYLKYERPPSYEVLEAILVAFPDISAEWLLRGEGPMLKSETGKINIDLISEQIESSSLVKVLVRSLESYQKHEDDLLNAIENLKKENNKLKQGLSNLKAS